MTGKDRRGGGKRGSRIPPMQIEGKCGVYSFGKEGRSLFFRGEERGGSQRAKKGKGRNRRCTIKAGSGSSIILSNGGATYRGRGGATAMMIAFGGGRLNP